MDWKSSLTQQLLVALHKAQATASSKQGED